MMRIALISFTPGGEALEEKLGVLIRDAEVLHAGKRGERPSAGEWASAMFRERNALVFIGAAGIAVRTIAPFVRDKLTDSPVLVIDEAGQYVIPILSGHVGGANALAVYLAGLIGAQPVLTTATDVRGTFAGDLYAKDHSLSIVNRTGIRHVAEKSLAKKEIVLSVEDYPPREGADIVISERAGQLWEEAGGEERERILFLKPKTLVLGAGCRKGKSFEELDDFFREILRENGFSTGDVAALATIDLKKDEEGLRAFARKYQIPFIVYSAEMLRKAPGHYSESDFVKKTAGVGNVCERAAVLTAGEGGELLVPKTARNGMTCAVVRKRWQKDYQVI